MGSVVILVVLAFTFAALAALGAGRSKGYSGRRKRSWGAGSSGAAGGGWWAGGDGGGGGHHGG
ncbi:hypothetical protein JBE04_37530, partial [Streptomyces sp. PRKS01-29]|nr:hypothetical protein [Streptomyces sabulosicollis]